VKDEDAPKYRDLMAQWGKFWTVLALYTVLDALVLPLLSWVPLYGFARVAFVVYLVHYEGAFLVYDKVLKNVLLKYEDAIDGFAERVRTDGHVYAQQAVQKAWAFVMTAGAGLLSPPTPGEPRSARQNRSRTTPVNNAASGPTYTNSPSRARGEFRDFQTNPAFHGNPTMRASANGPLVPRQQYAGIGTKVSME